MKWFLVGLILGLSLNLVIPSHAQYSPGAKTDDVKQFMVLGAMAAAGRIALIGIDHGWGAAMRYADYMTRCVNNPSRDAWITRAAHLIPDNSAFDTVAKCGGWTGY